MSQRNPIARAIGLAVLVTAGLCACASPQPVDRLTIADGLSATVGDLSAQNLLIIADDDGEAGVLLGGITNSAGRPIAVTIMLTTGTNGTLDPNAEAVSDEANVHELALGAQTTKLLGEDRTVTFVDVPKPGGVATVRLSSPADGSVLLPVPVLDRSMSEYSAVPTPSVPPQTTSPMPAPLPVPATAEQTAPAS